MSDTPETEEASVVAAETVAPAVVEEVEPPVPVKKTRARATQAAPAAVDDERGVLTNFGGAFFYIRS